MIKSALIGLAGSMMAVAVVVFYLWRIYELRINPLFRFLLVMVGAGVAGPVAIYMMIVLANKYEINDRYGRFLIIAIYATSLVSVVVFTVLKLGRKR